MPSTTIIIAAGVGVIYVIFGPLVLLGIYIFLDRMAEGKSSEQPKREPLPEEKEPALWSPGDTRRYLKSRLKMK